MLFPDMLIRSNGSLYCEEYAKALDTVEIRVQNVVGELNAILDHMSLVKRAAKKALKEKDSEMSL